MNELHGAVFAHPVFEKTLRRQLAEMPNLSANHPWFCVYALPHNVFAICEPLHFQEVISFLIVGQSAALLFDTGMGLFDITAVTASLTDLPIIVCNSHTHFDHIGDNHRFAQVHVYDCPTAITRLQAGVSNADLGQNGLPAAFDAAACLPFAPAQYCIQGCDNAVPIQDGHVFDLGGRTLKVLHTPGHSPDSIMLLDEAHKLLWTGDTVYPAALYAHLGAADGPLASDFATYHQTMHDLAAAYSDHTLLCSHNEPIRPGTMLCDIAAAFDAIKAGGTPCTVDDEGLHRYDFSGFSIITQ